jgi:eukaryotic-like serine/threonine-protein kinase
MVAPARADDLPTNAPRPGEVFEDVYRVGRMLGVGGVGFVFAAQQLATGDPVAIKMLLPEHARNSEVVERFLREGRIARRIESPHCTRVFDVATTAEGTPYLVMEYLEGVDLDTVLEKRGHIPYEQAVDWVLEACEGIAAAHATKTVHRDLKPANLFLAKIGRREVVKVLDFGISKSMALDTKSLQMTRTSTILGSPYYMSPEQFKSSRDVDERADIWSLGVILFELVSGKLPFDAPSLAELSVRILMNEAPPLTSPGGVPPRLANVVATCLRTDPALRFTNLADLADAIAIHGSPKARASAQRIVAALGMPAERASTRRTVPSLADTSPVAASLPPPPASDPRTPRLAASNAALARTIPAALSSSTGLMLAAAGLLIILSMMLIFVALRRRMVHAGPSQALTAVASESSLPPEPVASSSPEPAASSVATVASAAPPAHDAGAPAARPSARPRARATGMFGTEN